MQNKAPRLASAVGASLRGGVLAASPRLLKARFARTITNTAAECRGYRRFASQPRLAAAVADPLCWGVVAAPPRLPKRASRETSPNTASECRGYR